MAVEGSYAVEEGVRFQTPSEMAMISPISSQASSVPTFASIGSTGASAGYAVQPPVVQNIVTTNTSTLTGASSTAQEMGSQTLDASSFGNFGSAVGSASTALQSALMSALTNLMQLLSSTNQSVGTAAQNYASLDDAVAGSYRGEPEVQRGEEAERNVWGSFFGDHPMASTPPHKGPGGPGNEGPLPAHGTEVPNWKDYETQLKLGGAVTYFRNYQGWNTAADALQHYLDNTGTDFIVSPQKMTQDMPKFNTTVNDVLTAHEGQGAFDTGWHNTDDIVPKAGAPKGVPESHDWYYTADNFRYRVSGTSVTQADGSIVDNYKVDVYKPYIFGSPRGPINMPKIVGWTGMSITQDEIQDLNTTGLARNFNIVGSEHYTRIIPAPAR